MVSPSDLVTSLKVLIYTKTGIPPADQRIIYNGKNLVDQATLANYLIRPNSLLHLSSTLLGGDNQYTQPR
jgi:ubiquitin C